MKAVPGGFADKAEQAAQWLLTNLPDARACRMILVAGSGLAGFVARLRRGSAVRFHQVPHVGRTTVAGHQGELVTGFLSGSDTPLLIFSGRRHIYEGLSAHEATLTLRAALLAFPAIRTVMISNAAGALNPEWEPGDLMLIRDQVNWMFRNPLTGQNPSGWGRRFPDLSNIYSRELRRTACKVAEKQGISLREGVYLGLTGPAYETRAEVGLYRDLAGADAVGMSTVPEAIVTCQAGRNILGISLLSNNHARPGVTSHDEVLAAGRRAEQAFGKLVEELVRAMDFPDS